MALLGAARAVDARKNLAGLKSTYLLAPEDMERTNILFERMREEKVCLASIFDLFIYPEIILCL